MVAEGDGNDESVGIMCMSSQPPLNPILDEIRFVVRIVKMTLMKTVIVVMMKTLINGKFNSIRV